MKEKNNAKDALGGAIDMFDSLSLEQIIGSLQDGAILIDRKDKIILFNNAAENILGISDSGATGKSYGQVIKAVKLTDKMGRKVSPNERVENNYCYLINQKDGRRIPISLHAQILEDTEGNPIARIEILREISDLVRLEDDLRLSDNRYRGFFEDSKDMIFITDRKGRIKEVNQTCTDTLGYGDKAEILSLASVEKIYDNPLHWKVFKKQIDLQGFVKEFDSIFRKKDGDRVHCLISGHAVKGENEEIIGYEGIAKDITARMDAIRNFRQRHREMRVLNSVALAMNKAQDLEVILDIALKKALDALDIETGGIFLIDREKGIFSAKAEQGLSKGDWNDHFKISLHDEGLMDALLKPDLRLKPEPIFPPFKALLHTGDKSPVELTCFLITAKEKASGFLAFAVPANKDITTGQDFHLIGSLGNFLGGAIENTGLLQTIRQHREELKRLTAQLFHTQDVERKRIARELHDEAGQALIGINLTLETLEKQLTSDSTKLVEPLSQIKGQINSTYQEIRRISYRLHPALLSDIGLGPALESYFNQISKQCDLDIDYKIVGFKERINPEIEIALYRIAQELLTNTIKHSGARHFKLSIIKSFPNIILSVEDDGIGFNTNQAFNQEKSLGLVGMRERVFMLEGKFSISSPKGKGVRYRIEIPIQGPPDD